MTPPRRRAAASRFFPRRASTRLLQRPSLALGRAGLALTALFALTLAACSDSGVEIATKGAALLSIVSGDKQSGTTNAALSEPLVVRVTTGTGAVVSGATVNFEVTSGTATVSPASATTDILGLARTNVTLSGTAGNVVVKASVASNASLSASFSATATAPPVTSCTSSSTRSVAVGEVVTFTASPVCITPGNATGEFALVAHNQSTSFAVSAALALQPTGLSIPSSVASLSPADAPRFSLASLGATRTRRDWVAPAAQRADLVSRIPAARAAYRAAAGPRFSVAPAVSAAVAVGDVLSLNANANEGCTNVQKRGGRVVAVSTRAIIVADTLNPAGGYTTAEYESIANTFDTVIDPSDRANFGDPTDIDGNGRVILFFTRAVNALTPRNANYYIGGFFYSRDLFPLTPTNGLQACAGSNQAEMFYLMVPDPNGVVNGNTFSKTFVTSAEIAIVAHEYQHLINASRRIFVNNADDFEDTWLDEGLAHIAEELLFYARSGLTSRQNIDATVLRSNDTYRTLFNDDAVDNFGRLMDFMEKPSANSPYAPFDSLATRGAAWSFLRHAADHRAAPESNIWKALVNSTTSGMANIGNVLGPDVQTYFRQWAVSLITDDVTAIPADYQQPSWGYKTILPALTTDKITYPLTTVTWTNGTATPVTLPGGGVAYWRFSLPAGGTGVFSAATVPTNVTLTVARLR